ncbi:hypothetical protein HNY73_004207 [Argiope bruennichi]|uniref:Uncharacterized protein n=1 Tax=Argiope bruennichi TaxID=94029 RepID=A0A8T0FQL9_ARGBR|nr:hypothetical protein HNY73_004207 [Argiope bruennichi]
MSHTTLLPLKNIAMVKVSVIIYISAEFRNEYNKQIELIEKPFKDVKNTILEKYHHVLPDSLYADIHSCLDHIHKQYLKFAMPCYTRFDNLNDFCWKSNGNLSRYETIERLLKNPKLFDTLRLVLLNMHSKSRFKKFIS